MADTTTATKNSEKVRFTYALETLVKKEEDNSEGDDPLCDAKVREFTNLDWENAPNNISLRALATLFSVCSYQRDSLKASILKKIKTLDLESIGKEHVEEYLLGEIETIGLMADTTLPETWQSMISLKHKIKRLFPELYAAKPAKQVEAKPKQDVKSSGKRKKEETTMMPKKKAKPAGSKKATGGQAERKKVKTHKYKQDDRSRKWHCTPKVKVLEPKKEFDKYGPHCTNEKYYVKAVSENVMKVIDVSDERLQTLSLAVDKGAITDVALRGNYLLVGISRDGDFEATHDVKLYDFTYSSDPHIIWEQREQRKWQFGPVVGFGFCNYGDSVAKPYIVCKKKLVFPRLSHSFAFGDLEAGPEVLVAPDRLRVYNLKKEKTYYTRTFVDIEKYPASFSDKEQVGAYACIDKSGTYAVLSRPDSDRYFIQDLQTERNIGHTGFAATFIAKNEDGFFVLCDTGDCYQMIGKKNYYSTHVRMKGGVDHMAVYDDCAKVKCMKMLEDGKLQTFSFPEA